jgi:hypothetical protein
MPASESYFPIIPEKHNPPLEGPLSCICLRKYPKEAKEFQFYNIKTLKAIGE